MPQAQPSDSTAAKFPVSVKGVVLFGSQFPLLKNERNEWELPGGKLEPGEQPRACVAREIEEELGIRVSVTIMLDSWLYAVKNSVEVLIVTYACVPLQPTEELRISAEHKRLALFQLSHLDTLVMPDGYKISIRRALHLVV